MELNYDNLVTANESVLAALHVDCTEEELQVNMSYMKDADSVRADIAVTNLKLTVLKVEKAQEEEKNKTPSRPHPVSDMQMKCQLEGLKIQHFSGNIRDYPGWKISFQFAMRKYCQDEEEQLQRLKEAVLPPVRKKIIHCQSVVSAFEILDQNYGNSDELMTLFLRDIKSCKPLRNGDDKSLKIFASEIRSFITRMRDLNKKHDLKSDYIVVDLIDKLIPEDQYTFKSYCHDKDLPKYLETLVNWLGDEAQLRSSVFDDTRKSYKVSASNSVTFKPPQKFKAISQPCLLKCDASHTLKDCPAFYVLKVADR
ncbi:hypothetical protein SNE40_008953 [Patella caerulea]|uniref:Uncharacterized protein n=1 Tax=Patella caerulea TaxID=87958 RepID=A0AAN8PPF5_PATCE